jgi:CRISPR/Cas system-associated endonuclease Cas1
MKEKCGIHKALLKAKLESYLGFLNSLQHGKPSLVCDFMELYRYFVDDFLTEYCKNLNRKEFIVKIENNTRKKQGKREYLKKKKTIDLIAKLEVHFKSKVDVPRIKFGKKQC